MSAPSPAALPPPAMAAPAAPSPAPTRPPAAPGFAMRSARSPPVEQSAGTVATVLVGEVAGAGAEVTGAEVTGSAATGRAIGCAVRRARTGGVAATARGAGATTAGPSVGRVKYAVVTPVMSAVVRTRAMPIVASFQWLYIGPSTPPYDDEHTRGIRRGRGGREPGGAGGRARRRHHAGVSRRVLDGP